MITTHEAHMTNWRCDACDQRTKVYAFGAADGRIELPEGWVLYPAESQHFSQVEIQLVLCPDHAELIATAHVVARMLEVFMREREAPESRAGATVTY